MNNLLYTALFSAVSISALEVDLKNTNLYNDTAYIPSQCYTKTVDEKNENIVSNPCFSCHTKNKEPNYTLEDDNLQEAYDFPEYALKNRWTNLFKDRTNEIEKTSDKEILEYIREDNYKDKNNNIILKKKLTNIPQKWDFNNNKKWDGYIPDCEFNFDTEGFDRLENGKLTGWRAFAYYPFLGTFWPTNGSTDDVMIRLPKLFWKNKDNTIDIETYKLNLSIVESLVKQKDIEINTVDEKKYGIDLNQNGTLDHSSKIVFKWTTPKYDTKTNTFSNYSMSYVGLAAEVLNINKTQIAAGLYPKGTEFLHSVRYIDIDKNSKIKLSSRMKELRYAKKAYWSTYSKLQDLGDEEIKEKNDFPDRVDQYNGDIEVGLNNKRGWYYQGFIEDTQGDLRPQSYEETLFCIGCHSNIGAITDSTFVFPRKFEKGSLSEGWYHWSKQGLENIPDKLLENGDTEYVQYLKQNNAGDEFRTNQEIMNKFFHKQWKKELSNIENDLLKKLDKPDIVLNQKWKLKQVEIDKVKKDISHLILPSKERALKLNKAYKVIVDEQSFIYGRDIHITSTKNVHRTLNESQSTNIQKMNYDYAK
ncbi:hypothetical protein OAR97_02910 [Arcobacteraceae bacterium]|nr:hypothetical protein [Arcobacteraceae bacterium]